MDADCYQIDVLYFLNPHLIWVEVVDKSRDQQDFVFEQIGIYGILPYDDTTIEAETTCLMKTAFSEAKQIWFRPTHMDRRPSTFADIHKYGEIILMNSVNGTLELSSVLVRANFAVYNVCLFHQELSVGNLKTKLSYEKTQEIIRKLEKDNRTSTKSKKKKSKVSNEAENLMLELTENNLRKHDLSATQIDNIVGNKCKDFEKKIAKESSGRLIKEKRDENPKMVEEIGSDIEKSSRVSLLLKKKLELSKSLSDRSNSPHKVLVSTKQFLKVSKDQNKDSDQSISENTDPSSKQPNTYSSNGVGSENEKKEWQEDIFRTEDFAGKNKQFQTNKKKSKKMSMKLPVIDNTKQKIVIYGPPEINGVYLNPKVVPKDEVKENPNSAVSNFPEENQELDLKTLKTLEMCTEAEVDSNVNLQITNIDVLKEQNLLNVSNTVVEKEPLNDCSDSSISNVNESFDSNKTEESLVDKRATNRITALQKKLSFFKDKKAKQSDSSVTSHSDTTAKDSSSSNDVKVKKTITYQDSDDECSPELADKINTEYPPVSIKSEIEKRKKLQVKTTPVIQNNVNPFKNIEANTSVFVDKLVAPVLMAHNKMNYPIVPYSNIRDVHFNTNIHVVLKNLGVERPMMLQTVSWPVILRGYSLFMVGPQRSGKTFGYLPAVCRLINDECRVEVINSVGPSCIIVCATAQSVSEVEHYARMFLGLDEKVVSCYAGVDDLKITTSLLNGCDLFICTPSVLVRLLQTTDFGVDLRRLCTFVLEDCERLSAVYSAEVKYFLIKIKEMLKIRANKELKVQFIVASRVWCDFMEPLAKKSPNSVVCITAFQECVLYSKTNTTVDFIKKENKINKVLEFLNEIDTTKRTVIVCRSNDEVLEVKNVLTEKNCFVFSCDDTMTVEELYNLSKAWEEYEEPLLGPILVCCDGNLTHLNVTDANYLVHYSLPHLFSMFCKRFSVLNDNYSSIFREKNDNVKIKIFLEDSNAEQLPKILNFIKRCTDKVPEFLDKICERIVEEKDLIKAANLVPVCSNVLAIGKCPDALNCLERHSVIKDYDEPKDWVPRNGSVSFKILHYHTPTQFSARLLSSTFNGVTKKYPQTYSKLSLKMGHYYSKESNQRLHGVPKVGDICAVSLKQNFFVRCQVMKILTRYDNGNANCVSIKLIDEEKMETTRDIYLFYLPDELKIIETHVVQVRLANVCPRDKDITYSNLANEELKRMTANEDDLFIRSKVLLTVGNCILVDTLEACQELTSLKETVVMHNLKKELLNTHVIANPDHIVKMEKLCEPILQIKENKFANVPIAVKKKEPLVPQWAHLEDDDLSAVYFASASSPESFFIRLAKFESCMKLLLQSIQEYIQSGPPPLESVERGDIVIAKFPDDGVFERARVDDFVNEKVVKCFFVDQGDWIDVNIKDLIEMPSRLVDQMPFQAIECRLVGVQPPGEDWSEFGTNWFADNCYDANGDPKMLYVKHFTKEEALNTKGRKYGIVIIDTSSEHDLVINQLMLDLNLAQINYDEIKFLQQLDFNRNSYGAGKESSDEDELEELPNLEIPPKNNAIVPANFASVEPPKVFDNVFMKKPIRSVPLVDSDNESADSWDIVNEKDLASIFKVFTSGNAGQNVETSSGNRGGGGQGPVKLDVPCNQVYDNRNFKIVEGSCCDDGRKSKESGLVSKVPEIRANNYPKLKEIDTTLDSDDLSTEEVTQMPGKSLEVIPKLDISDRNRIVLDEMKPANFNLNDEKRKPKLVWRQNKSSVSIKIQLIGTEEYDIDLKDRCLKFEALCNDIKYGFDFDLYGVVENMTHSNKGQYILVKLCKVMKKNWLTLTKDGSIRKWIVYDVDGIDISSDEEEEPKNPLAEVVKGIEENRDSESEDDFLDDVKYEYKNFC